MIYGMFGILLLTFLMMSVTIAAISVFLTYKNLCHQNYDWWWTSFYLGASGFFYMQLDCFYFLYRDDEYFLFSGDVVYYLTSMMISVCFGLMCSSISVLASYFFVEKIYQRSRMHDMKQYEMEFN